MDALNDPQLQQFITQEKAKATANELIAKLTSLCWDKCITSSPARKFSSSEATCLSNCAHRYRDVSFLLMKRVQSNR